MKNWNTSSNDKIIAIWIFTGVAMLVIQIILGGITRLTGSGLSITEWDVVTGVFPPLNHQQWLNEFHKYQLTPQYRYLNAYFSLNDFKSIFFWEWMHRLWGRLIGFAFLIPFIIFLIQKRFKPYMIRPLIILFLLGAVQGAVGWIMVASGLTGDAIYVKPTKLAMHFFLACILISYAFWFGLQLVVPSNQLVKDKGLKKFTWTILILLFVQLIFGALMAGHKAAPAAPTWPDINGSFFPSYVFNRPEGWISLIENPIVIQFVHRTIAYIILIFILIWYFRSLKAPFTPQFKVVRLLPLAIVFIQICLGIFTVLTSTHIRITKWNEFEWMAELHQVTGICLLLSILTALFYIQFKEKANSSAIRIDPQVI
jgi:cytochrome c oxidase assembly protein subunit 15